MKLVPVAAAAMVGILLAGPAAAQTRRYVGRPVADVLKALQSPELSFIFTSDSVPQALLVKSEPKGRNDRASPGRSSPSIAGGSNAVRAG